MKSADLKGLNPHEKLKLLGKKGLYRHAINIDDGGFANSFNDLVSAHYEIGHGTKDCSLVLSVNAHLWGAVFSILLYGTEKQKSKYLPKLLSGDWIGAHAITEPQGGTEISNMKSFAQKVGDSYILTLDKKYITNLAFADVLVCYVRYEQTILPFIIEINDSILESIKNCVALGFEQSGTAQVTIANVKLSKYQILGGDEDVLGSAIIQRVMEYERAFIFSGLLGVQEACLDGVMSFCKKRKSGATRLFDFDMIKHKLAQVRSRLYASKLLISDCAERLDNDKSITIESSMTKWLCAEYFVANMQALIHLQGAYGLDVENENSAMMLLSAVATKILSGTSEKQIAIIANLMDM